MRLLEISKYEKKNVYKAISFMNETFECCIHENKELKDKIGMLFNKNKMLSDQFV